MSRESSSTPTLEPDLHSQVRLKSPAAMLPEANPGIQSILSAVFKSGLSRKTLELVHLRVSQMNGCAACLDSGSATARKAGETEQRLATLAGWRHAPWFSASERAALGLAESMTCIAGEQDPVPDRIWNEAARHFDEVELAGLVTWIALVNLFNRMNVAIRQGVPSWA